MGIFHSHQQDQEGRNIKVRYTIKSEEKGTNNNKHTKNQDQEIIPCSNQVRTTKYTLVTFLPKNLYEQFRRIANIYFLAIACLQLIPGVSPVNSYTTIVPLSFVLSVTAIKEAIEDYKRHKADIKVNNKFVDVVRDGKLEHVKWKDLVVGDVVRVNDKKSLPADLVLLSSSGEGGICYVETSSLDGETNLKLRQALPETANLTDPADLSKLQATLEVEPPNNAILSFNGTLIVQHDSEEKKLPLTTKNILLRGTFLHYTEFVYGVVVYAGDQTKQMQNSTEAPSKMSSLERRMNKALFTTLLFMIAVCIFSAVAGSVWDAYLWNQEWYLGLNERSKFNALWSILY